MPRSRARVGLVVVLVFLATACGSTDRAATTESASSYCCPKVGLVRLSSLYTKDARQHARRAAQSLSCLITSVGAKPCARVEGFALIGHNRWLFRIDGVPGCFTVTGSRAAPKASRCG